VSVEILQGDAREILAGLPPLSVDSIVTSPPYADARSDYSHVSLAEYPEWTGRWAEAAYGVVRHNLILNLGRRFKKGEENDYHEKARDACREVGWKWIDTVMWHKPNANPLIKPYLTPAHEYAYWLAKDVKAYRGTDDVRTPYAPGSVARLHRGWDKNTVVKGDHAKRRGRVHPLGARPKSVFVTTTGREKGNPHPAPMPLLFAEFLVLLSTPAGGTVCDPFAGSGTTATAALHHGRSAVLIDDSPIWTKWLEERFTTDADPRMSA
jgi:DNA modification methylase